MKNLKKLYKEVILLYHTHRASIPIVIEYLNEYIENIDDIDEKVRIQCEINELIVKYDK